MNRRFAKVPPAAIMIHPLNPLRNLLRSIQDHEDFFARRSDILDAIIMAAPCLGEDRVREMIVRIKGCYLPVSGRPSTPERMAHYVESAMGETYTRFAA